MHYDSPTMIVAVSRLVDRLGQNCATEERLTGRVAHRILTEYSARFDDYDVALVRAVSLATARRVYADRLECDMLGRELTGLVSRR